MAREITSHRASGLNDILRIEVLNPHSGPGGANHVYGISWKDPDGNGQTLGIRFQNGPISESGVNGITNEALLAIVQDRLEGFQRGPYPCDENAVALKRVQQALEALHERTFNRVLRGVEGTMQR